MAVGKKVVSAYSGPADVNSFDLITHMPSSTIKAQHSAERDDLEVLQVRNIRENKDKEISLAPIFELRNNHSRDWLLSVEIVRVIERA
jgi:phenylalanine-4-hydroxylase